ncbi:MAG TPA: DinB family protein [Pirellulales bacterium]|nr:DinB family protein [Pirellulales bacterium]
MDLKQRIVWQLQVIRQLSDQMLSAFTSPEEWTRQLFPGANHPLWIAGHVAFVDNRILGVFFSKSMEKPGYAEKFGRSSKPSPNPADYPPPDEVLNFRRERRSTLLDCIATLSDADFEKPVPAGLPPFVQNYGQMFAFLAVHEGTHTGQLSMCRRVLGHAPVVG